MYLRCIVSNVHQISEIIGRLRVSREFFAAIEKNDTTTRKDYDIELRCNMTTKGDYDD